jgi:hypothetical protein
MAKMLYFGQKSIFMENTCFMCFKDFGSKIGKFGFLHKIGKTVFL